MTFSSASAASLTTTTYPQSQYKKAGGTITLTDEGIAFHPTAVEKEGRSPSISIPWTDVAKHQVSPATHPKPLLKLVLISNGPKPAPGGGGGGPTFTLRSRAELDRIRRDIAARLTSVRKKLQQQQQQQQQNGNDSSRKRSRDDNSTDHDTSQTPFSSLSSASTSFTDPDPTAQAVTRSSLLSSNPTLREQHRLLVTETQTLSEEDFWMTHSKTLADEHARIYGKTRAGNSSLIKSSLDLVGLKGRVRLGVEEMRQIFILYPAVHRAYEEKVPLELSEEQFWRKYLESEFFHRDRGRIGSHIGRINQLERNAKERLDNSGTSGGAGTGGNEANAAAATAGGGAGTATGNSNKDGEEKKEESERDAEEQANARAAAVGTDDIFSRYDAELRKQKLSTTTSTSTTAAAGGGGGAEQPPSKKKKSTLVGTKLAVGQFDLASTAQTDRGDRFLGAVRDLHPSTVDDANRTSRGSRVIDKYNRHWAMVLNPEDATAGCDLVAVARKSVEHALENDEDNKANGGYDEEMFRLVGFADADERNADHVKGRGCAIVDSDEDNDNDSGDTEEGLFHELHLRNVEAYSGVLLGMNASSAKTNDAIKELTHRHAVLGKAIAAKVRSMSAPLLGGGGNSSGGEGGDASTTTAMDRLEDAFPDPNLGRELLLALSKKMASDAKTDADALRIANSLRGDFTKRLTSYFRRTSELLRHFFGLRNLMEQRKDDEGSAKLAKIVQGMEAVYREIEGMRKDLPQTEEGEMMRKMCLPLMDQLDWAFQLHRDGSGGGGGFVTVEEL